MRGVKIEGANYYITKALKCCQMRRGSWSQNTDIPRPTQLGLRIFKRYRISFEHRGKYARDLTVRKRRLPLILRRKNSRRLGAEKKRRRQRHGLGRDRQILIYAWVAVRMSRQPQSKGARPGHQCAAHSATCTTVLGRRVSKKKANKARQEPGRRKQWRWCGVRSR